MPTINWYLTATTADGWRTVDEATQGAAKNTDGWVVSTGSTNHSAYAVGVERAATTFANTTPPSGTLDTSLKDAFRSTTAYSGDFASANWTFTFSVQATTNGGAQDGRIRFRLIKANADGSSATEITSAQQQASLLSDVATTGTFESSLTFNPGAINLANQYLFIQIAWERTGAGGMTNSDINWITGSSASVGTRIVTADFTPAAQALTPVLFTNDQTFFAPNVTQTGGVQDLTPALFTNAQAFYAPTVATSYTLTPALFTNTQTFYAPTVVTSYTLTPALFTNTQAFYAPTVIQAGGPQDLTPALFTNDQTFYAPTVATSYTLTPALFTNTQTFYTPTVATSYTLTPALFTNDQTFYAPTVATSYTLTPALFTNDQTFYAPTVAASYTLTPALFTNDQTFYAPTVSQGAAQLTPDLFTNTQTFYTPVVTQGGTLQIAPALFTNTQAFYAPTVATSYTLTPALFTNTQAFYAPTAHSSRTLTPALFTNTQTFFAPTVELESYLVTKAQALKLYKVWLLHGLGTALTVESTERSAGGVVQSVTQAGDQITIDTTAAPTSVGTDLGIMIDELSLLHGLDAPLVVTSATRVAGGISQSIAATGGVTTVTRV